MKAEVVGSGLLMITLMLTQIFALMLTQDVNTTMKAEVVGSGLLMLTLILTKKYL